MERIRTRANSFRIDQRPTDPMSQCDQVLVLIQRVQQSHSSLGTKQKHELRSAHPKGFH